MEPPVTVPTTERRHYSADLKKRVIYQYFTLGRKSPQISVELDMPLRVVQRTLQLWNELGDVVQDPRTYMKHGRPTVLNFVACNVRKSLNLLISR